MGKVIPAEHRFRDKKNKHIMDLVDVKKKELEDWFKLEYPEAKLEIFVAFSRNVGEELEIKKQLSYKSGRTPHIISSIVTLHRHTWASPFLMEQFLETFVRDQQAAINEILTAKDRKFDYWNKELPNNAN